MKSDTVPQINDMVASIEKIGIPKKGFEFRSKKMVEELKKSRIELMEEAFEDAFEPNKNKD